MPDYFVDGDGDETLHNKLGIVDENLLRKREAILLLFISLKFLMSWIRVSLILIIFWLSIAVYLEKSTILPVKYAPSIS